MTAKFSKVRILNSNKYKGKRDAINAVLKDDELYTIDEVDAALEEFYEGNDGGNEDVNTIAKKEYEDITTKELEAYLQDKAVDYSEAKDKKALYALYELTFEKQEG